MMTKERGHSTIFVAFNIVKNGDDFTLLISAASGRAVAAISVSKDNAERIADESGIRIITVKNQKPWDSDEDLADVAEAADNLK